MSTDLAGFSAGYAERFVPAAMRGDLTEAEHLARYHWAARLAPGRRVLDAGCGVAYGSATLAAAGGEVVGVDVAEAVLESVRGEVPDGVTLERADLRSLPFEDGAFDLVCCFEVIEHIEEPLAALDELVRMLGPDGVLLISSPNPDVYPTGNPHHHREFRLAELASAVGERVAHVSVRHQHSYLTTAILADETFEGAQSDPPLESVELRKIGARRSGEETYAIVAGSRQALPKLAELAMMTGDLDLTRWNAFNAEQQAVIAGQSDLIEDLRREVAELRTAREQLHTAEQEISGLPDRLAQIARLEDEVARLDQILAVVRASSSWRLTAPLRRAMELARGRRARPERPGAL